MKQGRLARWIYSLCLLAITPLVLLYLLHRSRRQPAYRQHWGERFGRYSMPRQAGRLVWIHAVSVGETRAAEPLVLALLAADADCRIVMTHMTPTGRETSQALFGERIVRVYLPYDYPFAVRRFLRYFRPELGLLMETEVWPNLVNACARSGIPVALVNARLSEKSLAKALRWRRLLVPAMRLLTRVLAQSDDDASRLVELGAVNVTVTGNVKFDITPPPAQIELGHRLRALIGTRRVLLAASTRDGEEVLLLDAFAKAGLPDDVLLMIVPRHPQRFAGVMASIAATGMPVQYRSSDQSVAAATRVWLGDSMGELFAYYAAADVAYVGGGLLPFGTHNLIEPCALGCPVLLGPHVFNFAQAAEDALAAGAALQVADATALMQTAAVLLANPAQRSAMAGRALAFAQAHRGATARTMAALQPLLP